MKLLKILSIALELALPAMRNTVILLFNYFVHVLRITLNFITQPSVFLAAKQILFLNPGPSGDVQHVQRGTLAVSHSFLYTAEVSILMSKVDFETMFTLHLGKRFDNRNRLNHSFLFYATFRVLFFLTYHMISIS